MGGTQKYEGSPVQASSTTLTAKNNPVFFQDAVMGAFNKESGGAITPPIDRFTIHPHWGNDILHPRVDDFSANRIDVMFASPEIVDQHVVETSIVVGGNYRQSCGRNSRKTTAGRGGSYHLQQILVSMTCWSTISGEANVKCLTTT